MVSNIRMSPFLKQGLTPKIAVAGLMIDGGSVTVSQVVCCMCWLDNRRLSIKEGILLCP